MRSELEVGHNGGAAGETVFRGAVEDGKEDVMVVDGVRGRRAAHHRLRKMTKRLGSARSPAFRMEYWSLGCDHVRH